jgi:hypothetical protein
MSRSDQQLSQLQRTYFTINDDEAAKIALQLPSGNTSWSNIPASNGFKNITQFKNPVDTSAIASNNGRVHTENRNIIQYQNPVRTDDPYDSRTQNALVNLTKERTNNTPQVNELKSRVIVSQLSIDSKFRQNYFETSPSDYTIHLSTPLQNVISMRLASLELPNVSHVVSATQGMNSFKITKNNTTTSIAVASGNYDSWKLASDLNNIDGGKLDNLGFQCYIDEKSLRTTIKTKDNTNFSLDFSNPINPRAPPMKSLGWLLGFRNKMYQGASTYTSEAAIDLAGSKYFFLCVEDFNSSVHDVVTVVYENSFMQNNILARIPMREGKGVVLFDDCTDKITKKRHYFGPVDINKLRVRLVDEFGDNVDLVGTDYSLALEFHILYEK